MKKIILSAIVMTMMSIGVQAQTQNPDATGTQGGSATVTDPTADQLNEELSKLTINIQRLASLDETIDYFNTRLANIEQALESKLFNENGHQYVDLGVVVNGKPLYWATTNIGANNPADVGHFFAWGETEGYVQNPVGRLVDWKYYKFAEIYNNGFLKKITKYCYDSNWGDVDNKTELDPEDDAARVKWQGAWRMPTHDEILALISQCDWNFTTMINSKGESITGMKVSNKSNPNKYIFLPYTTYSPAGVNYHEFWKGNYWTSTLTNPNEYGEPGESYTLNWEYPSPMSQNGVSGFGLTARYEAYPIRPVMVPE